MSSCFGFFGFFVRRWHTKDWNGRTRSKERRRGDSCRKYSSKHSRTRTWFFKNFILQFIIFTKLFDHRFNLRISELGLTDINSLDIFFELDWAMNLNFFIGPDYLWANFFPFASFKSSTYLPIWYFVKNLVAKLEGSYCSTRTAWIHISNCASISNMLFQQKIRLSIPWTNSNPSRIICKVDSSIFHSFKRSSTMMPTIKHTVFPRNTRATT